jgi:hypothetical protein
METIKAHIQLQIKLKGKGRFKCYKLGYMFSWLAICFHGCKLGGKIFVGLFVKL